LTFFCPLTTKLYNDFLPDIDVFHKLSGKTELIINGYASESEEILKQIVFLIKQF